MKCKFIVPFLQDGSGVYWKKFLRRSRKKSWGNSANNWEQKSSLPWQKFASSSLSDDVSTRIWWQLREIGVANELFWGSSLKKSFIVEKSFASKSLFDLTWKPPPYEKLKTKKIEDNTDFFCNWGDLLFVLLSELQFVTNIFEILLGNSIHLVTIWFLIESKSFLFEVHKIRSSKFNLPESLVANKFWQIGAKNIPLDTFPFFFKGMYPMKCYFGKGRKYVFQ